MYNGEIRQRTQNYSSRPTFVKLFVFVSADVLCYNMIPKSQILPILLNTKNDGSAFHLHTEALNDLWCFTHFITDDDLNFYTHTHIIIQRQNAARAMMFVLNETINEYPLICNSSFLNNKEHFAIWSVMIYRKVNIIHR